MLRSSVASRLRMIVVLVLLCPASHVAAQEADPFFKGKTVTIAIGSSTGGGLDTYGRLVARHLGKHIPGNPTVVPSNMPGAGGNIVAGNLYAVAPKDGTFMGLTFPGVIVDPLLSEAARKTYDATKFNYVGNAHSEILVCLLRNDAKAKTPGDLLAGEVILGATAPGSTTFDFPTIANSVLGTKLKIITGYKGSREVTLAIEKGEVQGICGLGWSTVKVQLPEVLSGTAYARVLAQEDMQGHPVLNQHGVPLMTTLARTDDDRQVLQMFYGQSAFARPFILPPGIPHDRLALLRKAFNETMRDPELLAEAEKMKIDVVPSTGERVQELVARMYQTPVPVIERVKKALGRNK